MVTKYLRINQVSPFNPTKSDNNKVKKSVCVCVCAYSKRHKIFQFAFTKKKKYIYPFKKKRKQNIIPIALLSTTPKPIS